MTLLQQTLQSSLKDLRQHQGEVFIISLFHVLPNYRIFMHNVEEEDCELTLGMIW